MNLFKKIFPERPAGLNEETDASLFVYSQCESCGELFRSRIDKEHDLVQNFEEGPAFTVRKELVGARCRRIIVVELEFDRKKNLIERRIENGRFISSDEYNKQESVLK